MENIYEESTIVANSNVLKFVIESTQHFDDSHNHVHALRVNYNAHKIMESIKPDYNKELLMYMAMLHDVCDHKYPESIPREELEKFIESNLGSIQKNIVMRVIDNISFSKEVKGLREEIQKPFDMYLLAISDADRLEALGKVGIERCIEFTSSHGGIVPDDVVKHCHEKLLRLLPEQFIKTELGRKLAEPLHREVELYVAECSV